MIAHFSFLPVPVIEIFPVLGLGAELISVLGPPTLLIHVLHPGKTFWNVIKLMVVWQHACHLRDGPPFTARTSLGEGVALILVVVVVVESVVATVELTVDWRQIFGGCVDAEAF